MQKQALLSGSQSGRGLSGVNMWRGGGSEGGGRGEAEHFYIFCKVSSLYFTKYTMYTLQRGVICHRDKPSQFNNLLMADLKNKGNQFI